MKLADARSATGRRTCISLSRSPWATRPDCELAALIAEEE
jgi:hypothetical protein